MLVTRCIKNLSIAVECIDNKRQEYHFKDYLFLLHHILLRAEDKDDIKSAIKFDYNCKHFLNMWLKCCYIKNKKHLPKISELILSNYNRDEPLLVACCEILIKLGSDISEVDCEFDSPLSLAIEFRLVTIARLLTYYGCDLSIYENYMGIPGYPTDLALRLGRYDILKILVLCGARYSVNKRELPKCVRYETDRRFLETWFQQPHSLKYFCRKVIRGVCKSDLPKIEKLQYPRYLIDYIRGKQLF